MDRITVEIVLKDTSSISHKEVIGICKLYLNKYNIQPGAILSSFTKNKEVMESILGEDVEHILVDEKDDYDGFVNYAADYIDWYVYKLDKNGPQIESCEDESGSEVSLATHLMLPSAEIFNLWENLIYEDNIKLNLLNYASTMMEFTDRRINSNIISCNKVILLHGPPGTGKTSLCKALAQKLYIKLKDRYMNGILIEINSHSLFSKWFSESGKLVSKMFDKIKEVVECPETLVCVLIDEIESLAHAREQCLSGNEPSDAIKVVNAVLTQIDQIKRYPNVLIFTTSNMTAAIDIAFVDRADVKQYIGPPGIKAISDIYLTCLTELIKGKIINLEDNLDIPLDGENLKKIHRISVESVGLSGRMLRKIPFLAHALFLSKIKNVNLEDYLEAMSKAIKFELTQRQHFLNDNKKLTNGS